MEKIARRSLLFDFYGLLLTDKQQEIYDLYYQQDLSLGEIAEIQNVSRQAVFDLLRRTEEALENYDSKLGLVQRYLESREILINIKKEIGKLGLGYSGSQLDTITNLLNKLEDRW